MKSIGFIFALLFLQASASFFDNFQGAISKVEHSFGKLISDVVKDVKDTIQSTISAVENVLIQNGILDKSSSYEYKCNDVSIENIPPENVRDRRSSLDIFNRLKLPLHEIDYQNSPRLASMDFEKSITNADKAINDILGRREQNKNINTVSEKLKNDTNRLAEISEILRRELDKMPSSVRNKIKNIDFGRRRSSSESVFNDFQALRDIQEQSKNATEVSEINLILDEVANKLNISPKKETGSSSYNMEEIKNELHKISASNEDTKKEIENTLANSESHDLVINETKTTPKTFKDIALNIFHKEENNRKELLNTGKSIFSADLENFDGFAPFLKTDHKKNNAVEDAMKIIEDSKHTDNVLNDLFKDHHSGSDVFSNADLFNFGS